MHRCETTSASKGTHGCEMMEQLSYQKRLGDCDCAA